MENLEHLDHLVEAVVGRLFIPLEASRRHVHVTEAQAQVMFGHRLTPKRPLSQPGQFACKEQLTIVGPSMKAIEGILSPDGRVIGKMGHSERIGDGLYKNVYGEYDMKLFKSAVKYFK